MVRRTLALAGVVGAVLALAAAASAAIAMRLLNFHVQPGGRVRIYGNPRGTPLYALPARKMPCIKTHRCTGAIRRATAPRRPFILLGRAPGTTSGTYDYTERTFAIRLPRALPAGRYVVFVWCASCGGSLIPAGTSPSGQPQILDVRR